MAKYSTLIKWSPEDSVFIATIPELSGVSTFGKTRLEALQQLEIVEKLYLEQLKEDKLSIPLPEILYV